MNVADHDSTATLSIRVASPDDAAALALLGAATMLESYADRIPGADLVAHCATRHSAGFYATWLADTDTRIWLAETPTGAPAGYLVLMPATVSYPQQHPSDLEVQRIYVLSRYQGAGLGGRLMRRAVEAAEQLGAKRLVLGVLKLNSAAIGFYRRQGFEVIGTRQFQVGASVFDDHVMGRVGGTADLR